MFVRSLSLACLIVTVANGRTHVQSSPAIPSRWVGARYDRGLIEVSVAETGRPPRSIAAESNPKRLVDSLTVTDVAFDVKREVVYVGTCCEPGSGQLRRVDLTATPPALIRDDQGFAVDVASTTSTIARTDAFGTLAMRPSAEARQEVRAGVGAADVAVDGRDEPRVIALIQTARLRALIPTVPSRPPGMLISRWKAGHWTDTTFPLRSNSLYCRVVALTNGSVGLLAGEIIAAEPRVCVGERLDVYHTATKELRTGAMKFPGKIRHLSVDDSSTFLIFTTVDGAVGWQTLAGGAGSLARGGFTAADW